MLYSRNMPKKTITTQTISPPKEEIEYPTSDGQPMAETTRHRVVMTDTIYALERRYRDVPDVWVGGNLLLFYEEGNPQAFLAPDVLVIHGTTKWERDNYLLWKEGRPPSLVIEVTSLKTKQEDLRDKRDRYEQMGVEEYVFFDPYEEYLHPPLQGLCLQDGRYRSIPLNPDGSLLSRTTGVLMRWEEHRLRLIDAGTGELLDWVDEMYKKVEFAKARARIAAEASAIAEAAISVAAEARAIAAATPQAELSAQLLLLEQKLARLRGPEPLTFRAV